MKVRVAPWLPALLLAACAQVREPQGGVRDTQPPELVQADPPQFSTQVSARRIVLTFDERIRLDRVRDRLLVSPPLDAQPDVHMSGSKSVVIDLNAALDSNTTYTFNIGDAVLDLSENNPASGLAYVISTGGHIDSLGMVGMVVNAFTAVPEKDVLVMLHPAGVDSSFRGASPSYFTRTGKDGRFELRYLRPGTFSLYALRDQNFNYRYDLPNEDIAFHALEVDPSLTDSVPIILYLFREPAAEQQVMDARVTADRALRIVTARSMSIPSMEAIAWSGGELTWSIELNATHDSLLLWPSDTTTLAGRRFILRDDTAVIDTVRYMPMEKMPFYVEAQLIKRRTNDGVVHLLRTSRPVAAIDPARAILRRDSLLVPMELLIDTGDRRSVRIEADLAGAPARLELLPEAVTDIYGAGNDTLRYDLGATDASGTGDLIVTLHLEDTARARPGMMLQLLTAQDKVLREQAFAGNDVVVEWNAILPGTYGLKLWADSDGNARWDPGSLDDHHQPERVWRYDGIVTVRAAWDVEVNWSIRVQ